MKQRKRILSLVAAVLLFVCGIAQISISVDNLPATSVMVCAVAAVVGGVVGAVTFCRPVRESNLFISTLVLMTSTMTLALSPVLLWGESRLVLFGCVMLWLGSFLGVFVPYKREIDHRMAVAFRAEMRARLREQRRQSQSWFNF